MQVIVIRIFFVLSSFIPNNNDMRKYHYPVLQLRKLMPEDVVSFAKIIRCW